ncbi:hypothetical protein QM588_05110 [Rhodococcus sp. IEGM 1354]|uniref:hypothetical protein n=1 Tax=Rhodococcus sp. IEGM 1354 TaxID=3047088 RepID=UPI0024B7D835|nr:hypothetical protein [Rhodococcus sp. IEGM 1354]MDI9929776.1 hypothetical protein [Rhodococcus sp. IEGM 1354]
MPEPRKTTERIFEVKRHGLPLPGESGYVKVWNNFLRSTLSPRGAKIVGYLLSQTDGYKPQKKHMASTMEMNGRTVNGGINDAEASGYLVKQPVIGRGGKVVNTVYHVSQTVFAAAERAALSAPIVANVASTGVQNVQSESAECAVSGVQNVQYIEEQEKTKEEPPTPRTEEPMHEPAQGGCGRIDELKSRPVTTLSKDELDELAEAGWKYLPMVDRWVRRPASEPRPFDALTQVPNWVGADIRATADLKNVPTIEVARKALSVERDPTVNRKESVLRSWVEREAVRPALTAVRRGVYQAD